MLLFLVLGVLVRFSYVFFAVTSRPFSSVLYELIVQGLWLSMAVGDVHSGWLGRCSLIVSRGFNFT